MLQADLITKFKPLLLRWYKKNARDLPWRRTDDPYKIWVSEIMLQQTQVDTVIPYYHRFLKAFPDVHTLAAASQDSVLKKWEGLGYYSRARNLHRGAQLVASDFDGIVPKTLTELLKVPGIGRYTAGAIASIAFNQDAPILDGNIIRVLCRVFKLTADPKSSAMQKKLWSLSEKLIPQGKAATFNQAMMELGALTCLPRNPNCQQCPLGPLCRAKQYDQQDRLPLPPVRKEIPHYTIAVGVVWKDDKILIDRRKENALLGGLWEFPGGKRQKNESIKAAVAREVREELGIEVEVLQKIVTVKHAYSHFRITLHAYQCRYLSGPPKAIGCTAWKWVTPPQLKKYAFPGANQKIIETLLKNDF